MAAAINIDAIVTQMISEANEDRRKYLGRHSKIGSAVF